MAPRIEPGTDVAAPMPRSVQSTPPGQMAENAGDSKTEADGGVCPHHPKGVQADESEQSRQAKRTEDETDEAAEQADQRAGNDCCAHVRLFRGARRWAAQRANGAGRCRRAAGSRRSSRAGPLPDSVREETADDGAHHGGRGHPCKEPPVDASGTDVGDRARESGAGRDSDVRAGSGRRARGREHDHGQPYVPENEADEAAEQRSREAPKADTQRGSRACNRLNIPHDAANAPSQRVASAQVLSEAVGRARRILGSDSSRSPASRRRPTCGMRACT